MSPPARSAAPSIALLQEQRYRRHVLAPDRKQTTVVTAVVGIAIGTLIRNDLLLLSGATLRVTVALRCLHVVATVIAIALLLRARWPRQLDRAAAIALVTLVITLVQSTLTRLASGEAQGPTFGIIGVICILYFAHRNPIWQRALACLTISPVVLAVMWNPHAATSPVGRFTGSLTIVSLNIIGVLSARAFEGNRRERFEAVRREQRARQELAAKLGELAVEKERAEAASRARAAFLAAMSHEFRTPMNAVIGLSDVVLDTPLTPAQREHVRVIGESARALLGLLNDILDFAKIDAQKLSLSPAPFDLRALAASVVDMLRPAAGARSLALSLDLSPDVPSCLLGDDARLRQVLVNLLSNALKFTARGAVTLRITTAGLDGAHHAICFAVEDTGAGMTPEVLARLFRPFEQGDEGINRRHGGTGLGLAISKQIVAAMGGDIHVESQVGRGSTFSFTLRLPATEPPLGDAVVPAPRGHRPPFAILVVDDHPINREVARARLGRLGYEVDLASDGPEAVRVASRKDYDVIFMDLHMPGMSGVEAAARIREGLAGERAPCFVAMTASVFEEDRRACRDAGLREFVDKPIDLAQLDAVLTRVAEERGAALSGQRLSRLRRIEGLGEPAFVANLGRVFLADTRRRLPRMNDALCRGDAAAIEDEAHVLKSSSATLGATEMSVICARVERAAREGRMEEVGGGIEALAAQLIEVERALAQVIEGEVS